MKHPFSILLLSALLAGGFALSGCDGNDGPAEQSGEAIDDAVEDAGDAVEDATD